MMICSDGDKLMVGTDFADAVSGSQQSHGTLRLHNAERIYQWQSTLPIAESERIIRAAVRAEHKRVALFTSQAA